jgi:hypothetical protein
VTAFRQDSYTHVLIGDFVDAAERLKNSDSPINRRALVRAAFSGVEGLLWSLKQHVFAHARDLAKLTIHEQAALLEETYSVDPGGEVRPQPRFLPTATSIRLAVRAAQKVSGSYNLDFGHRGWQRLQNAIDVRHRIVHPKDLAALTVTDAEIADCIGGFHWLLALCIELREEIKAEITKRLESVAQRFQGDAKDQQ